MEKMQLRWLNQPSQKQSELELELLSNSCESPAYGMPYHRR